jgi:hypothetical protein
VVHGEEAPESLLGQADLLMHVCLWVHCDPGLNFCLASSPVPDLQGLFLAQRPATLGSCVWILWYLHQNGWVFAGNPQVVFFPQIFIGFFGCCECH